MKAIVYLQLLILWAGGIFTQFCAEGGCNVMPWPSCGNGWALSLPRGKSTASAAGLSPALKHRDSERRVSAERKAYGVRLVYFFQISETRNGV